ncbi:MAG: Cyclic di-GMP phosphodiesterase response regulator RpfG [bacterium ADurb.Bin429]|nr:MAG: Cyclic di-GMP phosphodiesterase response regulator RpfG [bacterium ADurb.Bin429]
MVLEAQSKLQRIVELHDELAGVNDLDILLEHVLTRARQFMRADAGSIYIRDGETLKFSYTQNDTLRRRLAPGKKLIYTTFSIPINHTSIAGYVASTGMALNIPDAYALSPDLPYHFNRGYDDLSDYRTHSMLTVPLRTSQGAIVGVLQLINALDDYGQAMPFSDEDEQTIGLFATSAAVALERAQMTRALILRMMSMAELRDPRETGAHVNRVGAFSVEIYETWAQAQGLTQAEIDRQRDLLRIAAMLHDVGKVAISDVILKKPGRFTPEEFEAMKGHTHLGYRLFVNPCSPFDTAAATVALTHHECWDGGGYPGHVNPATGEPLPDHLGEGGKPLGLRGEEIPLFGRIVSIADVYDALRSRRVYKDAMDEGEVLDIIASERGKKFDPALVDAFFACHEVLYSIGARYAGT